MSVAAAVLVGGPLALALYTYLGYPVLLKVLSLLRSLELPSGDPDEWPLVSVSLPAHNEEETIAGALDHLLAADYPEERLQIVVVSDASTDATDEIVRGYEERGVELVRLEERGGKERAENAAVEELIGDIVVNTDASTRVLPASLKALVRVFQDPAVGVASGRDLSVGSSEESPNEGEAGYTEFEMWLRSLETRVDSIVGASGCFYAVRRKLHSGDFPPGLNRDFASALIAREEGYRAVSVDDATCLVPRSGSLRVELRRKVRTMVRGLGTLWYKRSLLNPLRHGLFALILASHKLFRWLTSLSLPLLGIGLILSAPASPLAATALAVGLVVVGLGIVGLRWPRGRSVPRVFGLPGYLVGTQVAALAAWWRLATGRREAVWEPTRRSAVHGAPGR